jgi:nucleotide-binding universal stress UspA family protein
MKNVRTIFYATDFSPASGRALDEATGLAQQYGAQIWVVHAVEPVHYVTGEEFAAAELYAKIEETSEKNAAAELEKLVNKLTGLGLKAESLLLKGSAAEQVVNAAREHNADLIVIGTHGRTGLSKLFMGSVAGRIVSTADCPVLTVRGVGS